ncbi:efflux RND transporter periplasmic adaptor subunit [Lacimicrobium alkaliphilum]|uniref:Uncharacterized protein n=1 Tax=Lacimicrobium alkaliphilum TaxID=1526571 RepID=A0A0U3B2X3_9ALTE|nr:efflux RND transporter periplasmic adaptor subunit [Lacimicrobium alkaliphilum]ALS99424.1 hypothetical protein AT746_14930 [Lacimicrobium alkaliphilum]
MNSVNFVSLILCLLSSLIFTPLACAAPGDSHPIDNHKVEGPKGGKLLKEGDLAVEITIFESGIPPEMRVYAYHKGELVSPERLDLKVSLHRLGGVTDNLSFTPEGGYLVSNEVVTEPHSYEVAVQAAYQTIQADWRYESFEGRTTLSERVIERAGIAVEKAQPATLTFKQRLFGVIAPVAEQVSSVKATYAGEVAQVLVSIGDKVVQGQALAVVVNAASGVRYQINSPMAGEVTERFVNAGELADEQVLFEIVDLSSVWVELSAFPENIEKLKVGQQAEVFDLHQHQRVHGEVTYIAPVMTGGHIARARVLVTNRLGHWRPGMHVQADVTTGQKAVALAVEKDALQTFRGKPVVFARFGNTFEVRMPELGETDGNYIEVKSGLSPGIPYVVGNSYLLKADILKDGASHNH